MRLSYLLNNDYKHAPERCVRRYGSLKRALLTCRVTTNHKSAEKIVDFLFLNLQWWLIRHILTKSLRSIENALSFAHGNYRFKMINFILCIDDRGFSKILNTVGRLDPELLNLLLKRGTDPNIKLKFPFFSRSYLHHSVGYHQLDICKELLDGGADINVRAEEQSPYCLKSTFRSYETPVECAKRLDYTKILELFESYLTN